MNAAEALRAPARWREWEIVLCAAIWAMPSLFGQHAALINEIAILALFALSVGVLARYLTGA